MIKRRNATLAVALAPTVPPPILVDLADATLDWLRIMLPSWCKHPAIPEVEDSAARQ